MSCDQELQVKGGEEDWNENNKRFYRGKSKGCGYTSSALFSVKFFLIGNGGLCGLGDDNFAV